MGYGGAILIEKRNINRWQRTLLTKAMNIGKKTAEILTNKRLTDKRSALKFIYKNFLDNEPSLAFCQIGKTKNGRFKPFLTDKRERSQMIMAHLNNLTNQEERLNKSFYPMFSYLIYQQNMHFKTRNYGKLFIAFNKDNLIHANVNIYRNVFTFTISTLILGILIFTWYYRKEAFSPKISDQVDDEAVYPKVSDQLTDSNESSDSKSQQYGRKEV